MPARARGTPRGGLDVMDARLRDWNSSARSFWARAERSFGPVRVAARKAAPTLTLALLTLVSVFVLLPNGFYKPFTGGQDPHWQLALCIAFERGWVFGRDIVFTYGPLGLLEGRSQIAGIKHALVFWDLSFYGVVGWVLYRVYGRLESGAERLTALLHVVGIGIVRTAPGTQFVFPLELYFIFAHMYEERRGRLWLGLATLCAIVGLYIKVSTGLLGVIVLGAYFGYRIATTRPRASVTLEAGVAVALLGLSLPLFHVAPIGYLKGALELGTGYAAAMGSYDARQAYWITVALFLVATLMVSVTTGARRLVQARHRDDLIRAMLVVGTVFVYFKQGFVRLDERHFQQFFRFAPLAAAFFYLYGQPEVKKMLRTYLACSVAACVAQSLPGVAFDRLKARYDEITGYLAEAGRLDDTAPRVPRNIPRLPASFVAKIGHASVDVVPHDLALAVRYQLHYTPRPLIQSYVAFTPYLDELDAGFFRGAKAPKFVVYSHEALGIPPYAPWWSAPRSKLALLERYEVVGTEGESLLLGLRGHPWSVRKGRSWKGTWQLGKPLPVPASTGLVMLSARVGPSLRGALVRAFYRPAPLRLEVRGASRSVAASVVPAHLADGLLVNWFVDKASDARDLFAGDLSRLTRVDDVQVLSERPGDYRPNIEYEFLELLIPDSQAKGTEGS
jgi:hypothetical protein